MSRFPGALLCTAVLALAVVTAAHVSSCYSPPTPDCGFSCNESNGYQCPPDYTCAMADQTCKLNTAPAGMRCQSDAAPDLTPKDANQTTPTVVSHTPDDGATNVSRTDAITATFSLPVVPPDLSDFLVEDGPTQLPGTYSYAGTTASFTPSPPLPGGHTIRVTLTSGISSAATPSPIMQVSWTFTTIDDEPPQLILSNPLDTQTMVPITNAIVMTFSEPVSVPANAITVSAGATGVAGIVTSSADALTITFTPSPLPLPPASTITVALSAAIVDMAVPPNALAPTQFSFTTQ